MNTPLNDGICRRAFLTKNLGLGAMLGLGCFGMAKAEVLTELAGLIQDQHKFQTPISYTYEKLFNFAFGSWFISYMKQLENALGTEKFLNLLMKAGADHYRGRVSANFEKIEDKSVRSLIENFWEPTKNSNFGSSIMTIDIPYKAKNEGTVQMTECLFAKTFRENDAGNIGYAAICYADFAVAREFNPKIKMIRNQCLMNGDASCLFEYSLSV
jgi:hypothetical protein